MPLLASYFQISIDELIGYVPYISKAEIRKIYRQLCIDFTVKDFADVHHMIQKFCKKYYACHELQLQMGVLLVNHFEFAPNRTEIMEEAIGIFERICRESADVTQKKLAIQMKALCYMTNGRPDLCIETLEPISEPLSAPDRILAEAYMMTGHVEQAKSIAHALAFQISNMLIDTGNLMFRLYHEDRNKLQVWGEKMLAFARLVQLETCHPTMLFQLYLSLAVAFAKLEDEQALEYLEQAIRLFTKKSFFPIKMKENALFEQLDGFFERFQLENEAPRNEKMIQQSLKMILSDQGPFASFQYHIRFKQLKQRIENI